jgi:uncharacterized membrane protein YfcA
MLTPTALAVLGVTIPATSFLSGVFGMAGGIVLLAVLLAFLDVAPAMILFGATQAAANGWRMWLWRSYVQWHLVRDFAITAVVMFVILKIVSFVPNKAVVYIGLGLMPFIANALPKSMTPDITRPGAAYFCGALITFLNLVAGVAGSILDVFYQKSGLDRRAVVATKAAKQCLGHVMRVIYFGSFASLTGGTLPIWVYAGAIALAMAGTTLAARVLEAMSNESFRHWSWRVIATVSGISVARGVWLLVVAA